MESRKAPLEPCAPCADGPATPTHAALVFDGRVVDVVNEVDPFLAVGRTIKHFHIIIRVDLRLPESPICIPHPENLLICLRTDDR